MRCGANLGNQGLSLGCGVCLGTIARAEELGFGVCGMDLGLRSVGFRVEDFSVGCGVCLGAVAGAKDVVEKVDRPHFRDGLRAHVRPLRRHLRVRV